MTMEAFQVARNTKKIINSGGVRTQQKSIQTVRYVWQRGFTTMEFGCFMKYLVLVQLWNDSLKNHHINDFLKFTVYGLILTDNLKKIAFKVLYELCFQYPLMIKK